MSVLAVDPQAALLVGVLLGLEVGLLVALVVAMRGRTDGGQRGAGREVTMCDDEWRGTIGRVWVGPEMVPEADCEHKWVVYSTAVADVCLLLQCERCQVLGVVEDPSNEEWHEAFWAPGRPYEWRGGDDRVRVTRAGAGGVSGRGAGAVPRSVSEADRGAGP